MIQGCQLQWQIKFSDGTGMHFDRENNIEVELQLILYIGMCKAIQWRQTAEAGLAFVVS